MEICTYSSIHIVEIESTDKVQYYVLLQNTLKSTENDERSELTQKRYNLHMMWRVCAERNSLIRPRIWTASRAKCGSLSSAVPLLVVGPCSEIIIFLQ